MSKPVLKWWEYFFADVMAEKCFPLEADAKRNGPQEFAEKLIADSPLTDRARELLRQRYGREGKRHSYIEIGVAHDVTSERARQIIIKALRIIREHNDLSSLQ